MQNRLPLMTAQEKSLMGWFDDLEMQGWVFLQMLDDYDNPTKEYILENPDLSIRIEMEADDMTIAMRSFRAWLEKTQWN